MAAKDLRVRDEETPGRRILPFLFVYWGTIVLGVAVAGSRTLANAGWLQRGIEVGVGAGTSAKSGHSLRMARRAVRLQAQVRNAAAMLVAPLMRSRLIAVFRRVAITRGAFPVLTVDASSR